MAVTTVQKNEDYTKRASYLTSGAIGTIAGFSLKYAIPITAQEKDVHYHNELKRINIAARQTRRDEIEAIRNAEVKSNATDTFIKMYDNNNLRLSEIKKLKSPLSDEVMTLFSRINEKAKVIKRTEKKALKEYIKGIRPAGIFLALGLTIGLGSALIYNIINQNAKEKAERYIENLRLDSEPSKTEN